MILIRADANEIIGTGHVMRCLSIAHAFAKKGKKVMFITADHRGDRLIQQNGFSCICLDNEWTDMDGEIDSMIAMIKRINPLLLLVDSYFVTDSYLSKLSEYVKTVYVDDFNTKELNVDALINYNIFYSIFDYTVYEKTRTKLLLGPQYAPLRDEFRNCPKHENKNVSDVLVSAGGSDPERTTEKFINDICPVFQQVFFHFIVGSLNPRVNVIKQLSDEHKNVVLHINENKMSSLMNNCDIAISAAGTTLYELCACGIPTITYSLADNQLVAAEQFDNQGVMLSAGDFRGDAGFIVRVEELLLMLLYDSALRRKLSDSMQALVDGYGADRIVDALLCI